MWVELNHLVPLFGYAGFHLNWVNSVTTTMVVATICLSLVVVTGYTGQLSLAQYALAGIGRVRRVARRVGRRAAGDRSASGTSASRSRCCSGSSVAIPVGLLVGLPALRTRGVNLAIATLGLALLIERVVLGNADYTGGFAGTVVKPPESLRHRPRSARPPGGATRRSAW